MIRLLPTLILTLSVSAAQAGQSPSVDAISAGYARLYNGDRNGAFQHFEALRAQNAGNLAAWFGQLVAQRQRLVADESLEPPFEGDLEQFLRQAGTRYDRAHADAEALFYLSQAFFLRAEYRVSRNKGLFGAARDAAKAKGYADAYIKQHPEHGDAYFVLGMYNYYVDIAPNFIKVIRVFLFLPPGNRVEGLKQLERAGREGNLFAPMAERTVADLYGSFEGRAPEAVRLVERLQQRFPENPDFRVDLARLYASPTIESFDLAAEQYQYVIDRSDQGQPSFTSATKYRALLGLAELRRSQWRLDEAIATVTPAIDANVSDPPWVLGQFLLNRNGYRMALNDPRAFDDAKRLMTDPKVRPALRKAGEAQFKLFEQRRQSGQAATAAALVPGNRLTVERRWDEARASYEAVRAAHPDDWQVRYRLAYLDFARGRYDEAAHALESIVAASGVPGPLKANVWLTLGQTYDLQGRRADAVKQYKRVLDEGNEGLTANAARVGLVAPFKKKA